MGLFGKKVFKIFQIKEVFSVTLMEIKPINMKMSPDARKEKAQFTYKGRLSPKDNHSCSYIEEEVAKIKENLVENHLSPGNSLGAMSGTNADKKDEGLQNGDQ